MTAMSYEQFAQGVVTVCYLHRQKFERTAKHPPHSKSCTNDPCKAHCPLDIEKFDERMSKIDVALNKKWRDEDIAEFKAKRNATPPNSTKDI